MGKKIAIIAYHGRGISSALVALIHASMEKDFRRVDTLADPPMTQPETITMTEEKEADHVLIKRGLYYRPNGNGYTGLKSEAGLYHASYALGFDGVLALPFADAPDFAPACWEETKIAYFEAALATARAEAEALRDKALQAVESVRAANAGNFKREGKEWSAYDQACLDCHAALTAALSKGPTQ